MDILNTSSLLEQCLNAILVESNIWETTLCARIKTRRCEGREAIYLFFIWSVVFYTERADTSQQISSPADRSANPNCRQGCHRNSHITTGRNRQFDLVKFLANVRLDNEKHLLTKVRQKAIKWYIVGKWNSNVKKRDVYFSEWGNLRKPWFKSVTSETGRGFGKIYLQVIGMDFSMGESPRHEFASVQASGSLYYVQLPKTLINSHTVSNTKNKEH